MSTVHLPAPLRSLTGGAASIRVSGSTVGEVIEQLEQAHPGLRERLLQGDRLRPGLAVFVDDQLPLGGLRAKVEPDSVIYIAPAVAGGAGNFRLLVRIEGCRYSNCG